MFMCIKQHVSGNLTLNHRYHLSIHDSYDESDKLFS